MLQITLNIQMKQQLCYRCDLLSTAALTAVERHIDLLGKRRLAEGRSATELIVQLDGLIADAERDRDIAFRHYLAHRQADEYALKRGPKARRLLPAFHTG
jgi:hypothetical protein